MNARRWGQDIRDDIWNAISFIPNFMCKTAYSDIIGNNSRLPFLE